VLVLVVDTSTPAVSAGVMLVDPMVAGRTGVQSLTEHRVVDERAHGELLAPAVRTVLSTAGIGTCDLAAVVAGVGPGPFTGLRVGLVTAAVMGDGLGIPTYGVCSLDGIGLQSRVPTLVATDARRKEIYWAVYRGGVALSEPSVDRPDRVAQLLDGTQVQVAVGDGAQRHAGVLPFPVLDEPRYPSVLALGELAADRIRSRAPSEALTPLYLRRPDAEQPHRSKRVTP
jgi:tRNA threonylcarbamoyl adenosine modification protein YeaZ